MKALAARVRSIEKLSDEQDKLVEKDKALIKRIVDLGNSIFNARNNGNNLWRRKSWIVLIKY
jgi:hypothetical protein